MDPRAAILANFVESNEIVQFKDGTYEEITSFADKRNLLFKFEKNPESEWKSIPLQSKKEIVTGFIQSFGRMYDAEEEVYAFLTLKDEHDLDVGEVLSRPCELWDGQSDLTQLEVIHIINMVIDKVRFCELKIFLLM